MEKEKRKKKKIGLMILLVLTICANLFLIYNILLLGPIEKGIRYIIITILIFIDSIFVLRARLKLKYPRKKRGLLYTLLLIYFLLSLAIGLAIAYIYGTINGMNKKNVIYTSSLVVLNESKIDDIKDVKNIKIGIVEDEDSIEGNQLATEVIKEQHLKDQNEIISLDSYLSLLQALYTKELDAVFVPQSYKDMFRDTTGFEDIDTNTKIIFSKKKEMLKKETSLFESSSTNKSLDHPFTVLLMGVDSEQEGIEGVPANGDSLILVTFNPKTLNATMLSIPRDSYVPIACFPNKVENKITHAASYGLDCMMQTIQNYFDITIDYYAKINFKGIVKLVDTLGGIDVEVPADLCTDNSNREGEVCIQQGSQHLNGEQALVLARNRKQLANGDLDRGLNQQIVLQGIINQIKNLKNVTQLMNIIETISNNFDTNFTTEQILSFYNIGKDIIKRKLSLDNGNLINIQQLYLQGTGQMILNEYIATTMILWNYVPNKESRNDIVMAMKQNLEIEDVDIEKSFTFSIDEPYEVETIGYGPYSRNSTYSLLPNFVGYTQATASSIANRYHVSVTFQQGGNCASKTVCSQNYLEGKRIDLIRGNVILTIGTDKVSEKDEDDEKTTSKKETDDTKQEENSNSSEDDEVTVEPSEEEKSQEPDE